MTRELDVDVAVIGGGLAGLTVAAALADRRRVCVVEREDWLCRHASGRAAAMFVPTYGGPVSTALARASRRALEQGLLTPKPILHLAATARDLADLQARGRGRIAAPAEIARLVPGLAPRPLDHAFLEADGGLIDLSALVERFRRVVSTNGAILTGFDAETIETRRGRWRLRSATAALGADVLVDAAGPWADEVARRAGAAALGLNAFQRTLVEALPPDGLTPAAWPIMMFAGGQGYLRPAGPGVWVSAGEEDPSPPCDARPDPLSTAKAMDRLSTMTGRTGWTLRSRWAGLRTFAADRSPVLGWDPATPNLFWAAGLGGTGVQCAPAFGRCAAQLILDDRLPGELSAAGLSLQDLAPGRLRAADRQALSPPRPDGP